MIFHMGLEKDLSVGPYKVNFLAFPVTTLTTKGFGHFLACPRAVDELKGALVGFWD